MRIGNIVADSEKARAGQGAIVLQTFTQDKDWKS